VNRAGRRLEGEESPSRRQRIRVYYHINTPFLPDLAHLTVDLRKLLKKDVDFMWLQPHQEAFELIRQILTYSLVVKPFDTKLKTELLTDASRLKGLGMDLWS
jgi:hypothetical protein